MGRPVGLPDGPEGIALLNDAVRSVLVFIVVCGMVTLATFGVGIYVGHSFGLVQGRQEVEVVACTQMEVEPVKRNPTARLVP